MIKVVQIVWNDLMDAFGNDKLDRIYFLDKFTGSIFFVPASIENEEMWDELDSNLNRFLEIPPFDNSNEKKLLSDFISQVKDDELKNLLLHAISGKKPYAKISDIISFFPEYEQKLIEQKDEFISVKMKRWLDANELFSQEVIETEISKAG